MNKRMRVMRSLLLPKLYETMGALTMILRQGFDVQVSTGFSEVKDIFLEVAHEELEKDGRAFRLVTSLAALCEEQDTDTGVSGYLQTLYVGDEPLPPGYGFVDHPLGPLDVLISSPARMVMTILREYGLEAYIEVFDAPKMKRLKRILRVCGFGALIDAVVKTAFLCGFQGTQGEVEKYLEECLGQTQNRADSACSVSLEFCARRFLDHVMSYGEDAHSFLKSTLSYYAITARGDSATRASQILSVSRTTMMEHLRLAEALGVPKFFEGSTSHGRG